MLTLKLSEGAGPSASITQELVRTEGVMGERHGEVRVNAADTLELTHLSRMEAGHQNLPSLAFPMASQHQERTS